MEKTDNNPLVSIIVPVYKAEKYIYQCIDSLLAQTYRNIEIILVDDGSPDRSGAICDEYAAADSRVKVIHQTNGGVSVARQTGMDNATGIYSIHADPDDWVEPAMIEELVAKALETGADYTFCDYYEEYGDGTRKQTKDNQGKSKSITRYLELAISDSCCVTLWHSLIKRSFIRGLVFKPIMNWREDQLFTIKLLVRNPKIAYLPKAFYHYRCENESSLTHSYSDKHMQANYEYAMDVKGLIDIRSDIRAEYVIRFKINVLKNFIRSGRRKWFKKSLELFPEAHEQAIQEGRRYKWCSPLSSCLSMALRGKPKFAYFCYRLNMLFIEVKESLRKR